MDAVRVQMNEWGARGIAFLFLIDFEMAKPQVWRLDQLPEGLYFDFGEMKRYPPRPVAAALPLQWTKRPIAKSAYGEQFRQVQHHLSRGDTYLANLTCPTPVTINWSAEELFWRVRSRYKVWLTGDFLCFSPETFVQIKGHYIYTYPIKGTVDASLPNARSLLLNNPKEAAEHATIVDLLRNDLGKFAKDVSVIHYRNYEEIAAGERRLGQVYSEIRGVMPGPFHRTMGDIVASLLPAGSVSGAPKEKTIQILREVEKQERGYYTGIFGIFDGVNLDSCVLIRYLQSDGVYRSGGGITFQSRLDEEYDEMINKVYVPIS